MRRIRLANPDRVSSFRVRVRAGWASQPETTIIMMIISESKFEFQAAKGPSRRRVSAIVKVYIHPVALPRHATTYRVWSGRIDVTVTLKFWRALRRRHSLDDERARRVRRFQV